MSLSVLKPDVSAAVLSPTPAIMNGKVTLTVTVTEKNVILEAETITAGEFYSGEV